MAYEGAKGGTSSEDNPQVDLDKVELDAFRPESCNVAFGSAFDGWAFRLDQFASMYAEKLSCNPEALTRALWGSWSYNVKEKKVVSIKGSEDKKGKNMFVQFALEPIWKAYSVCEQGADVQGVLSQIVKSRGLSSLVPSRSMEQSDPRQAMRAVMRAWLPLSEAVLGMAVNKLPSPSQASPYRITRLLHSSSAAASHNRVKGISHAKAPRKGVKGLTKEALETLEQVERSLTASSASPEAPLVVFVSKMVAMPSSLVPRQA